MVNWIDKAVTYVDPIRGANRMRARVGVEQLQKITEGARKFEGASVGRRTDGWFAPSTSVNAANGPALVRLRDRVRDLKRNNPWQASAISNITGFTIGTGIMPQPVARSKRTALDIKGLWVEWAESTDCDADGLNNFYGLQTLIMSTLVESGEVLVRRRRRTVADNLPVPMQLQVLEPDFLDTIRDTPYTASGGFIMQGVEFDKLGRRIGYWLFAEHPGEASLRASRIRRMSAFCPAEDILHLFRVDRPGQVRGIPWSAPTVVKLKDFDEYEDAELMRKKIAACFAAFVQDIVAPDDATAAADDNGRKVEPGAWEILPPGKTVTFPNVPSAPDDGHSVRVLRAVAAAIDLPYEVLTGDYSQVNFSSARMAMNKFFIHLDQWQWHLLIPRLCVPTWRWFRDAAVLSGYDALGVQASWTPPRRQLVDATREVPAIITSIRGGLTTLSCAIREAGYDPDEHFAELKSDAEKIDSASLILDSDPRKTMKAGIAQSYVKNSDGEDVPPPSKDTAPENA